MKSLIYGFILGFCLISVSVSCVQHNASGSHSLKQASSRSSRTFRFDYSNLLEVSVWVHSVKVLDKDVTTGWIGPKVTNGGGFSDSRNDASPELLVGTQAHFTWWHIDDGPIDNEVRKGPVDPSKRYQCKIPFPEFEMHADKWECNYTLQSDNVWAARFCGVVTKQLGIEKELKTEGRWIHFYFRNRTGSEITFAERRTRLFNRNNSTLLYLPNVDVSGELVGYSATCEEGSIYRPETGSAIELVWYPGNRSQTVKLPEFAPNVDNWYCYFTLEDNATQWDVEFEGTQ